MGVAQRIFRPLTPARTNPAKRLRAGAILMITVTGLLPNAVVGQTRTAPRPDIVLILTDDQRWDTLWAMPIVQATLVDKGMTFSQSFVVNPLCCPSRTTMLTGRHSNRTGIYDNEKGWQLFRSHEDETLPVWLDRAGYRTGLIGKYLNSYDDPTWVPAGWDRWFGMLAPSAYFAAQFSDDGALLQTDPDDYSTDIIAEQAESFILDAQPSEPLFMVMAPFAPHREAPGSPAAPAPRHQGAFAGLAPHRPPSFNEKDVSDKPGYIQAKPRFGAEITTKIDALRISQYEALLAVDEAVGRIVQALDQAGRLSNTLIVFTSDNGLTWGEHRISLSKNLPYEESIRVPLIMRYDGLIPSGGQVSGLVANIDLAPTFVRLAGATAPPMDGRSLVPLFDPGFEVWRDRLLIEHGALQFPAFCQIRFERFSYVLYQTGEEELYGLSLDPHQLSNVAPDGRYDTILDTARSTVETNCQPRPPGF